MNLSVLTLCFGVLGLLLGWWLAVVRADGKKAKTIILLASVVCLLGAGNEIAKSVSEGQRERATQKHEAEQRKELETLIDEVRALAVVVLKSYNELDLSLRRLPASATAALREEARQVRARLSTLIDLASRDELDLATLEQLKVSIKETQARVQKLSATIEKHVEETFKSSDVSRDIPTAPIERPPARDVPTTGRTENPLSSLPTTQGGVISPTPLSVGTPSSNPTFAQETTRCSIEIGTPKKGDKVAVKTQITGSATVPAGMHLWVFARKSGQSNWWPQGGGRTEVASSGRWSAMERSAMRMTQQ